MKRHIIAGLLAFAALAAWQGASAQHTLGFTVGYGMGNGRFQPQQEMRAIWGLYSGGLSWRYYGKQRFVGGFGIDLEFQQQGFSFATNASQVEEKKDYLYYSRHVNSIVLPVVWQPHVYMFRNRMRVYLEPPRPSPITSLRLTRTSRRGPTGLPTGREPTISSSRATTVGVTGWPGAAASPS